MRRAYTHPLFVRELPEYAPTITALLGKLSAYRVSEPIDWHARVEAWLSNFSGMGDQRLALGMLGRLRVVSDGEIVTGCKSLVDAVRGAVPKGTQLRHFAHETSGGLLVRILEKDLKIRSYAVLRQADFTKLDALGKLRDGDAIVVWDRFNGTGRQLDTLGKLYTKTFAGAGVKIDSLHFAYIAGHPPARPLPGGTLLHRWIEDVPTVSQPERDLCERYAAAAGASPTNQKYDTGALITFSDNPPNNMPLILRAKGREGWFPLLDRKETARP